MTTPKALDFFSSFLHKSGLAINTVKQKLVLYKTKINKQNIPNLGRLHIISKVLEHLTVNSICDMLPRLLIALINT
jgi:hypothetical protein